MIKAGLTVFAVVAMLHSVAGVADDEETSAADSDNLPATGLSLPPLSLDIDDTSRWRPTYPLLTPRYSTDWSQPFVNVAFHDSGTLARVSRFRSLSLLTFAEIGQSRLFFGVNNDGLVGLHFRAFRRQEQERHLEVARMPYLQNAQLKTD